MWYELTRRKMQPGQSVIDHVSLTLSLGATRAATWRGPPGLFGAQQRCPFEDFSFSGME